MGCVGWTRCIRVAFWAGLWVSYHGFGHICRHGRWYLNRALLYGTVGSIPWREMESCSYN